MNKNKIINKETLLKLGFTEIRDGFIINNEGEELRHLKINNDFSLIWLMADDEHNNLVMHADNYLLIHQLIKLWEGFSGETIFFK